MKKLIWYYHRFRAMSVTEINYRVKQKLKKEAYKRKYVTNISILDIDRKIDFSNVHELKLQLSPFLQIDSLSEVQYATKIKAFTKEFSLDESINWHEGMYGEWAKEKSSFEFQFRNQDKIGDIRFTWEINRHQFFINLASQYKFSQDPQTLECLKEHFYKWVVQNPFLKGVNWSSSMEVAIRAYQWMITYYILQDIEDVQFLNDLLRGITNSTAYVMNNLSLHSSANNHLILEVAISSIIGNFLGPVYKQSWFESGYKILQEQIPLQVYDDGVNKEQGVHYHAFVLDMMLQYNYFLRSINHTPIHEELLYKMVEFLGYLQQGGSVTEIGDSDDAKIIDVSGKYKNYYLYLLQLASIYFKEQFIKLESLHPEVKLFSGDIEGNFEMHEYKSFQEYKEGGYEFLNLNKDYLIFDVGPLGFGSIAAHGHADALSVVYHYNQEPILVDPGTYIYNIETKWRDYFRKTSSHNTLSVQDVDQSTMNGPFLWSKKASTRLLDSGETEELLYMSGCQDGYAPAIHERSLTYMKEEKIIIIADSFIGEGQINFTFDSGIALQAINKTQIYLKNKSLYMSFSQPYTIIEKWISKKFLEKEKSTGIKIKHDFRDKVPVITVISKEPIEMEDIGFIYKGRKYRYESYKHIGCVKY